MRTLAVALTMVAGLGSLAGCGDARAGVPLKPVATGATAPVAEVAGQRIPAAGQATLLSFLDLEPGDDGPSRSQLTVLKSMATQFDPRKVLVVVVETSGLSREQLVNLAYDWDLQDSHLAFLAADQASRLQHVYRPRVPDSTLVAPDGTVHARWQGAVIPAQELVLPLQQLTSLR